MCRPRSVLEVDPVEGGSCSNYDYTCGDPVNHVDSTGTFRYTLHYDLGSTDLTPSEYMTMVERNFGTVFPITGRTATLPGEGTNMDLRVGPAPFPVYVSRKSPDGWMFRTRPGHPDYPGWISFKFSKTEGGRMRLTIRGYVPDYSLGACPITSCWLSGSDFIGQLRPERGRPLPGIYGLKDGSASCDSALGRSVRRPLCRPCAGCRLSD